MATSKSSTAMTGNLGNEIDPVRAEIEKIQRTATIVLVELVILAALLIFQLGVEVGQRAAGQSHTNIFP